ncbi:hypothetical protein [Microbulbifer variabilis]|uniref:hypothetical protein n=1 Tax=Microbulbifer variabilis TaxID=266805 RepID=UPI001CFEF256|nr:hypothetical protein [Microbulbifer variabilis]
MAGQAGSCTEAEPTAEPGESPRLLTVSIREDALVDLLAQRVLCAEALHCPTPQARRRLRQLLLRSLSPIGDSMSQGPN